MRVTIQAMSIFVRAVGKNSFAGPAGSLLIDRAAVSRTIKTLETDLGIPLFARSTRALRLTPEGKTFYLDCVDILKKHEEATQRFHINQADPQGLLKVGLGPGLPRRMLMRAIPSFQQQYKQMKIIIFNVDEVADIEEKGVDLLVRTATQRKRGGRHAEPQGIVVRKLAQSRFVVCASPDYLEKAGVPRTPADLARHVCVVNVSLERDIL